MERRAVIPPSISRAIGALHLPREICNQLLCGIYTDIPERYDRFRLDRDPENEACFLTLIKIASNDRWHLILVSSDDTTADDRLFVEAIDYRSRPYI